MRLLILSSRFPYPTEKGDKLRLYHQIKGLSQYHEIYLFSIARPHKLTEDDIKELEPYCKEIRIFYTNKWDTILNILSGLWSNMPFQVKISHYTVAKRQLVQYAQEIKPDMVFCQLIRMAPYAVELPYLKVIDYMDAYGIGMQRRAHISSWPTKWIYKLEANRTKKYEKVIAKSFDKRLIISAQDAKLMSLGVELSVSPNGIAVEYYTPQLKEARYDIGFIGNMGYLPNVEGARLLVKKVIPLYEAKYQTKLSVLLAGARPSKTVLSLQNDYVKVTGWINDIRDAYADTKIMCAMLYSGTGQQNKILEAMAMGIPCITTPEVNSAIGAQDRKEILIVSTPSEAADAIDLLLSDKYIYENIKHQSRQFVEDNFKWENVIRLLNDELMALPDKTI